MNRLADVKAQVARAKLLAASNFGRKFGWYVVFEGAIIGELDDYRPEDMFWDSYKVTPRSEANAPVLLDPELWLACRFRFQSIVMNDFVDGALCAGSAAQDLRTNGRVVMRGLYLVARTPIEKECLRNL